MNSDPAWLANALADVGLAEIPGVKTAPQIERWLVELGLWWRDDETPWCGVALAAWVRAAGLEAPRKSYRALSWLAWGIPIQRPRTGAIVVFDRGGGKGHVAIVVAQDSHGRLMCVGGNQRNAVRVSPFSRNRVLGYRWPTHRAELLADAPRHLPMMASTGEPESRREA